MLPSAERILTVTRASSSGRHACSLTRHWLTHIFPLSETSMSQMLGLCATSAARRAPNRPRLAGRRRERHLLGVEIARAAHRLRAGRPEHRHDVTALKRDLGAFGQGLARRIGLGRRAKDLTTTTLATAAVEHRAIAAAAPHSISFDRIISCSSLCICDIVLHGFRRRQAAASRFVLIAVRHGLLLVHHFGQQFPGHTHPD